MRPQWVTFLGLAGLGALVFLSLAVTSLDARVSGAGGPTLSTRNAISVLPIVETGASHHAGDTADDVAIWAHPTDPSQGLVIGNDKFGGLMVWGLDGVELQYVEGTNYTNLDIRYNFPLAGSFSTGEPHVTVALVAVGDEPGRQIDFFKVNPATRRLEPAGSVDTTIGPYGSCMYHSAVSGKYYSFVTARSGVTHQWELRDGGAGGVAGTRVRQFDVGTQSEGCVADDVLGHYYVGEEEVGIWKYGAEPEAGSLRTQVDNTGPTGNLAADVEGMSIYYAGPATGYLLASSQGNSTIVVYAREGLNPLVGKFSVGASGTIDAVNESDGVDVANLPLGGGFELGLLAVHDAMNEGATASNIKFVPWASVATALGLAVDTSWDPRIVGDVTPPSLVAPVDMIIEATGPLGAVVTFDATATDDVSGPAPVTCVPAAGSMFSIGATAVTCSAADKAGNLAVASFVVTVRDTTAPVVTVPADQVGEATGPDGAAVTYPASSASDVVGVVSGPTCSLESGSVFPIGSTTVTCTALDAAGNEGSASFLVNVVDTTAPSLEVPAAVETAATGPDGAMVTYATSAVDLVDGIVGTSCTPASGSTFPLGTTTVVCTAQDGRGNLATASFDVTVLDMTLPVIDIPDDIVVEASGPDGAAVTFTTTAVDAVDGVVPVACSPASGSVFPLGATTVMCMAQDAAGNEATSSFTVRVEDTTPPAITVPSDIVVEATAPSGAIVPYLASAADIVDGSVGPSCVPASGSVFPLGETVVTCTARDFAGNEGSASFSVTVRDTTPPDLAVPANVVLEATGPSGALVTYVATAADLVDGVLAASCSPTSGSMFPLGETTVACTATDSRGNIGSASFPVNVRDTTAPSIAVPSAVVEEATGPSGAAVSYPATALDVVDGFLTPSCTPTSGSTFPLGGTTVVCTAEDAHGNVATASFLVTVRDTTRPVLTVSADLVAEATGPDGAVVGYPAAVAFDVVGVVSGPTCVPASGSTFPLGGTTVVCTAQDAAGNEGTATFRITIRDTTAPSIDAPGDLVAEATAPTGAVVTFTVTSSDSVDGAIAPTCSSVSGSRFPVGTTVVTCTARDRADNEAMASFLVTIQDTTPPVIQVPADMTIEATGPDGAVGTFQAAATDVVDGALVPVCSPASGSRFSLGTTTVTCTAEDAHGNPASTSFTITVLDTTPPALSVPADIVREAAGPAGTVVTFTATAADLVDGAIDVACSPPSESMFPLGASTVTCSAADSHGNGAASSFLVTVRDTTPPAVDVPAPVVAEATGPAGAAVTFVASAVDLVDGALSPTCLPPSGSVFPLGATLVTCTVRDAAGNMGAETFQVIVQDTTAPAIDVPADITLEATGPEGAVATFVVTATDLVDGVREAACTPASGSTFPIGVTTVACTAEDTRGNEAEATFRVTVTAPDRPVITVPADTLVEATGPAGALVTFSASATDPTDGTIEAVCSPPSGSTFPLGTTDVTCTAEDSDGNVASGAFRITVRDTTPPAILAPGGIAVEATGPDGAAVTYVASAADLVDGTVAATCSPASGSVFPLGETSVICTSMDSRGNLATTSFLVAVEDTTPPAIQVPDDLVVEATGPSGAVVIYLASAVDLVDGPVAPTCVPASGSVFPLGTSTVTCTATDVHENVASVMFDVTVRDTTPPLVLAPADRLAEATGPGGATVVYPDAQAFDAVGITSGPSCAPSSGAVFPLGTTVVTCTARDAAGNPGFDSFLVVVVDTTPPSVEVHGDIAAEATGPSGAAVAYTASAVDLVDGAVETSCTPASGSTFPLGTTTVACTAEDARGNVGTASFAVTVRDTTPPAIQVPEDMIVEATGPAGAVVSYPAAATDLVDGALTPSCAPASGSLFPLGPTTVTCTAGDARGNAASDSFSVTVRDTTPPTIAAPPDRSVPATGTLTPVELGAPTVSDLVDPSPVFTNDAPAAGFPVGTTIVTWTATDDSGNAATAVQRVTVTQPGPQNTPGKITAGGASVDRVTNFGFIVSSCDGVSFHGQIEYQDRSAGINLHTGTMTSLVVASDRTTGRFGGNAHVNGVPGYTFRVEVRDRGEPGRSDEFTISIPELSYAKGGILVRGNVQIHKAACGLQASAVAVRGAIDPAVAPGMPFVVVLGLILASIRSHLRAPARLRRVFVPGLVTDRTPHGSEADREHGRLHEEMGRIAREAQATLRTTRLRRPDRERLAAHGHRVRELIDEHRCYEAFQELRELYALSIGYSILGEPEDRGP